MGFDPYRDYLSKTGRQLLLTLPGLAVVVVVVGLAPSIGRWQAVLLGVAAAALITGLVIMVRRFKKRRGRTQDLEDQWRGDRRRPTR